MLGPTPIEFSPLFIGQFERAFTLGIREAFPKGDGKFGSIPSWEPQKLGEWAGCHGWIVSRVDGASQYSRESPRSGSSEIRVICLVLRSAVTAYT